MKKKIVGGIIAAILILGVAAAAIWFRNKPEENEAVEIKAGNGEEIVYASIDKITGNDVEVTILSDAEAERIKTMAEAAKQISDSAQTETGSNMDMAGGMPDMSGGGFPGGNGGGMPDMSGGGFPGGNGGGMPDMSGGGFTGEGSMSDGSMPDMSEEGRAEGDVPTMENSEGAENVSAENDDNPKGQEKASYRIPVGTDVITTLGATTTFSHLEEGDTVAILMEQDSKAILKIWMIM